FSKLSATRRMLHSKTYLKRTKKGNAIKAVKEHYLRDDIWCSVETCSLCKQEESILSANALFTQLVNKPHYIIPDAGVFINQIGFIEHQAVHDVIVLQTVYEEVRNLSFPIYNRLRIILCAFLVLSEISVSLFTRKRDTYTKRLKEESLDKWKNRVRWYSSHLREASNSRKNIEVVLLSDDMENINKAKADGLLAFSVKEYIGGMSDYPELMDMVESLVGVEKESRIPYEEGSIQGTVDGVETQIRIVGRQFLNRSIQGDTVAVQLLPKSEWKKTPTAAVIEDEEGDAAAELESDQPEGIDDDDAVEKPKPTGSATSMIPENVSVFPVDRRIPKIYIRTRQAKNLLGQRILVAIDSWPKESRNPLGHFVRALGSAGDKDTETEVLLLEHDIPFQDFTPQVLNNLPPEGTEWRAGTPLDEEAANRGTTVYLVDKRIDMLPALLGTSKELNSEAEILNVNFSKSVISSKASLTYEEAQMRIDDTRMQDDLTKGIRILNELAKKLRRRRMDRGALTLASPEVKFTLDFDSQDPVDVEMKELRETNALVEEFMLLANISVAEKIYSRFPKSALLRNHPSPFKEKLEELSRALGQFGLSIQHDSSKSLADSLDKAVIKGDQYFNTLLRIMTTRCMLPAAYICSGSVAPENYWHYGLATNIYTHFTSPIRRYPDIIVHRMLAASLNADSSYDRELTDARKMQELCESLNYRHRMAQMAARNSVELHTNIFFREKIEENDGYVVKILNNGFVVFIPKYGIEGVVCSPKSQKSSTAAPSPIVYNIHSNCLESTSETGSKISVKLFDQVTVQVKVKDLAENGGLRLKLHIELLKPFIPGLSGSKKKEVRDNGSGSGSGKRMKIKG
ncbi:4014_t:CDS:10, partial [Acaulospora colombiana]